MREPVRTVIMANSRVIQRIENCLRANGALLIDCAQLKVSETNTSRPRIRARLDPCMEAVGGVYGDAKRLC